MRADIDVFHEAQIYSDIMLFNTMYLTQYNEKDKIMRCKIKRWIML